MSKNFSEFFAGVGLIHEGLARDGWICEWANDISESKRETYAANFDASVFHLDDIWNYVENFTNVPDDCFLYTASFPCTDLSVAGDRKGLAGAESGTLHAFLNILERKNVAGEKPAFVMLENVQGFLTSHNGKDVATTVEKFNSLGYIVDIIELDAAYFTPQSRSRVFLFAIDEPLARLSMKIKPIEDILSTWWDDFDTNPKLRTNKIKQIIQTNSNLNWGLLDIPAPPERLNSLNDIIETSIADESTLWWNDARKKHLFDQMIPRHQEILATMCEGQEYSYGTVYRRMREKKSRAELRTDGIAGCLRTPKGGSSKQIVIRAGFGTWQVRLLTPREYARLQGVRDSFILPQNTNQGYFAMGDAVCVPAIQFISSHVISPVYTLAKPMGW